MLGSSLLPSIAADSDRWGAISGVVRYSSGLLAPGVKVTVEREGTSETVSIRSGGSGTFAAERLAPGIYSVRAEARGHGRFEQRGIALVAGQLFRQDAVLQPAGAHAPSPAEAPDLGAVQEVRPVAPRKAARPGSAGRFLPHTRRDGTNEFHGTVYYDVGNSAVNARGFFGEKSNANSNNVGAFIGGPIFKEQTFFTYQYDIFAVRSGPRSGFGNSSPIAAFRQGDFSELMGGRALAADALGRGVLEGQLFDPASTRLVGGTPVRDAFPNNRIPASHPMISSVAARVIPFMEVPQRPGLEFNVQGIPAGSQLWALDARSHFVRVDHTFSDTVRAGIAVSRTSHPALRNCGGAGGCEVAFDPLEHPESNRRYVGTGFHEDITTHHVRQRVEWIARANLLSQLTIQYDEFHIIGHPISAGAGWQERLWGPPGNGLLSEDAGPPALEFTGNTRYSPLGNEWGRSGFMAHHRYRLANDVTWMRGRHTVTVGGDARHHRYPFRGWASNVAGRFNFHRRHTGGFDARGNNLPGTGDPFASFLLGQVNSTHFQVPGFPTISENLVSWAVVDKFDLAPDLTITFGLRFDYQSAMRERDDNMSTFDPNVPNPGAAGRLGAMVFAGAGPGRTGTRTLEAPPMDAFGPRVGFAYRVGDRSVVRGAYGIDYATVPHEHFESVGTLGFRFHATSRDLTNGLRPAYLLDDGFPRGSIAVPPYIDPSMGNDTSPVAVTRDRTTLPRIQHWTIALQRHVTRTSAVELAYEGSRGSRLIADRRVLGPAANANDPAVLSYGPSVLAMPVDSSPAASAGVPMPYRGFARTVAQSLRPFPHMLNIGYMHVPAGNSFFHALRARFEKRFTDGAHLRAAYAWSKLTGMGAGRIRPGDGLGLGPQNPTDTHSLERGLSSDDVPHRVTAAFTHALPVFRNRREGIAAKFFGGWAFAGMLRMETGTPVNVVMANDLEPFLFNGQKRPNVLTNRVRVQHRGSFDTSTDSFFDRAAFADPGPLRFGSASRTMDFVRGFSNVAEDFSLFKDTWINQKFKIRFQTQFANVFNRVVYCDPNRNWSAASFGRVFAQCNLPRTVQFGLRMDF